MYGMCTVKVTKNQFQKLLFVSLFVPADLRNCWINFDGTFFGSQLKL